MLALPFRVFVVLTVFALLPSLSLAAGETALASREIDLWPSAAAMGAAAVTSTDPLCALWVNPAGLMQAAGQAGATHTEWIADTRAEQLAVSLGGASRLRAGVSALVVTTSDIPLRPSLGNIIVPLTDPVGTFEVRDVTIGVSAAYRASASLSVGTTLRSLTQKVYTHHASSLALDLGLRWQYRPRISFAVAVNNLGPALDWGGGVEAPLPRSFRGGVAVKIQKGLLAAGEAWLLRDKSARVGGGVEWRPAPAIALRSGYLAGSDSHSFTAGVGLAWRGIGLDYALVPLQNSLGTTHRLAVRVTPSLLRN